MLKDHLFVIWFASFSCILQGARTMFTELFSTMTDLSDLGLPDIELSEEDKMIWIIWRCPASGIVDATDTFIFGDEKKIHRQNVVLKTAA